MKTERRRRLKAVLQCCHDALVPIKIMEKELYEAKLTALSDKVVPGEGGGPPSIVAGDPGIIRLEAQLLHLGSMPTVTQGVFYILPVQVASKKILVR